MAMVSLTLFVPKSRPVRSRATSSAELYQDVNRGFSAGVWLELEPLPQAAMFMVSTIRIIVLMSILSSSLVPFFSNFFKPFHNETGLQLNCFTALQILFS